MDRETVRIVLARYNHLLKFLFKKYQNTGYRAKKNVASFEDWNTRATMITEAEVYKLLLEHGVTGRMLPKKEFHTIMTMFNTKQAKSELNKLEYEEYR
jgi:hypothetical protein